MKEEIVLFLSHPPRFGGKEGGGYLLRIIAGIFVLLQVNQIAAQDILILKSGRQMKVSVVEESGTLVKYREYGAGTGPLYSIEKNMVESIKYSSKTLKAKEGRPVKEKAENNAGVTTGEANSGLLTVEKRSVYQDGRKLSKFHIMELMEDHPEALQLYETSLRKSVLETTSLLGSLTISAGSGFIISSIDDQSDVRKIGVPALAVSVSLMTVAIVLNKSGKKNIMESVSIYNSKFSSGKLSLVSAKIGLTQNGAGLTVKF